MHQPDKFLGSLKTQDLLTPPEGFIPGLNHIFVVVGSGSSDIGKGWLASSAASLIKAPLIIKIDPMLNQTFPVDVGVSLGDVLVTDDFTSYSHFGLEVSAKQNLVMGDMWKKFLETTVKPPLISPGHEKKLTQADFSEYLSQQILALMRNRKPKNVVMNPFQNSVMVEDKPL